MSTIAFIPARCGSKRVKNKNIANLNGHPLLAYSINIALKSGIYSKIYCITDSKKYKDISIYYGANDFPIRPKYTSKDKSSDDMWVKWALNICEKKKIKFDFFSILRPTSPFRSIDMIKQSINDLKKNNTVDSIRAVEKTGIHPGKIWKIKNGLLDPILKKYNNKKIPWHSCQYAELPVYYSQNASLETIKKKSFLKYKIISGKKIKPLFTKNIEGFDINKDIDLEYARIIIKKNNKKFAISKKSWFIK
jgi:N-acylneuraminate cytidylyltransferase